LLALAVSGASVHKVLNAVVRATAQVRTQETRAAIFIFDPDTVKLRFAAAEGLSEGYTGKIDNFPVGPGQPSCGKAAYVGDDVIVGDVATDAAWAPFRELADEHGIRACWSFLLKGSKGQVLGTFALYHRAPCEPARADYEEVRYFANIASLVIEKHVDAETRRREQAATEESLRTANRQKDAFFATLAHELRNPLGAITNNLAIIERAGDQAEVRERALQRADRQLKQMQGLIEDLLDANRIERGGAALNTEDMALQPAVEFACETAQPQYERKAQTLQTSLPPHALRLRADPVRVRQMLANLLDNASKFTAQGGSVVLSAEAEGDEAVIRVRDNGIGIASDHLASVFTMFAQLEGAYKGANRGLGIGLALVRNLAQMHDGSITAHSDGIGKGSEFILRLPLARD
jgi:signal transduction histidine kinase